VEEKVKQYLQRILEDKTVTGDFLGVFANLEEEGKSIKFADAQHPEGIVRIKGCVYVVNCIDLLCNQGQYGDAPGILTWPWYSESFLVQKCCPNCPYYTKMEKQIKIEDEKFKQLNLDIYF
jgi:hypothetical protein